MFYIFCKFYGNFINILINYGVNDNGDILFKYIWRLISMFQTEEHKLNFSVGLYNFFTLKKFRIMYCGFNIYVRMRNYAKGMMLIFTSVIQNFSDELNGNWALSTLFPSSVIKIDGGISSLCDARYAAMAYRRWVPLDRGCTGFEVIGLGSWKGVRYKVKMECGWEYVELRRIMKGR